jgi:hypothetical protein
MRRQERNGTLGFAGVVEPVFDLLSLEQLALFGVYAVFVLFVSQSRTPLLQMGSGACVASRQKNADLSMSYRSGNARCRQHSLPVNECYRVGWCIFSVAYMNSRKTALPTFPECPFCLIRKPK